MKGEILEDYCLCVTEGWDVCSIRPEGGGKEGGRKKCGVASPWDLERSIIVRAAHTETSGFGAIDLTTNGRNAIKTK